MWKFDAGWQVTNHVFGRKLPEKKINTAYMNITCSLEPACITVKGKSGAAMRPAT